MQQKKLAAIFLGGAGVLVLGAVLTLMPRPALTPVKNEPSAGWEAPKLPRSDKLAEDRDRKRLTDAKSLQVALEKYYGEQLSYPAAVMPVTLGVANTATLCSYGFAPQCPPSATTFMSSVPMAPTPIDGACSAAQNAYTYQSSQPNEFSLSFCLGGATNGFVAGMHVLTSRGVDVP